MWKQFFVFLVVFPGAFLVGGVYFWRKYIKYPTGAVVDARAKKEERKRVLEARKELRRIENS